MVKGRRERDRPKVPPGALYNPNKRVRLSYDSDDEGEEQGLEASEIKEAQADGIEESKNGGLGGVVLNGRGVVQAEEEQLTGGTVKPLNGNMDEQGQEQGEQADEEEATKPKDARRARSTQTGQFYALGSPPRQDEDESEDAGGSADEAMAYLHAVRVERDTLPGVLNGMAESREEEDEWFNAAFENDHAFIGSPDTTTREEKQSAIDPREAFTEALKGRFAKQRHLHHLPASPSALAALDHRHPITYPPDNSKATLEWLKILRYTPPLPAQLRSLDQVSAFRLLELVQERLLLRQKEIKPITSAWIWSLLARLDEVGGMNNDRVWAVRAFGKKAVLVLVSFRSAEAALQLEEVARGEGGATDGNPDEIQLDDSADEKDVPPTVRATLRENTLATLDSILVIVGDVFGQRDLLEFRQPWEVADAEERDG